MGWGEPFVRRAIPEHLHAEAAAHARKRLTEADDLTALTDGLDIIVDATLDTAELWLEHANAGKIPSPGIPPEVRMAAEIQGCANADNDTEAMAAIGPALDTVDEWVANTWLLFLERYEATHGRRAGRMEEALRSLANPLFRWNDEERADIIRRALDDTDEQPFKGGKKS